MLTISGSFPSPGEKRSVSSVSLCDSLTLICFSLQVQSIPLCSSQLLILLSASAVEGETVPRADMYFRVTAFTFNIQTELDMSVLP